MRKLTVACCVAVAFALVANPAIAEYQGGPVGVDVTIERHADGTYRCAAVVTELTTGEVVAAPKIGFRSGEDATVRIGIEDSEGRPELKFEVSADESAGTAQFRLTAVQGGVERQLQQVRVRLR